MVNEVIYFIPPFLAITLIGMGITYQKYIMGTMGALLLFLYGVAILIQPITGITSLMNDVIGAVSWGTGAVILIQANLDTIEDAISF